MSFKPAKIGMVTDEGVCMFNFQSIIMDSVFELLCIIRVLKRPPTNFLLAVSKNILFVNVIFRNLR